MSDSPVLKGSKLWGRVKSDSILFDAPTKIRFAMAILPIESYRPRGRHTLNKSKSEKEINGIVVHVLFFGSFR